MTAHIYTLDWETAYRPGQYSLSSMTTTEYLRDERFRPLGLAVKPYGKEAVWVPEDKVEMFLKTYGRALSSGLWLMHHAHFDGAILSWKYGLRPVMYLDTLSMARALLPPGSKLSLAALCDRWNLGEKAELRWDSSPEELAVRGTQDAVLTEKLFRQLMQEGFPKSELAVIDLTVRFFTEPTFIGDAPKLEKTVAQLVKQKEKLLEDAGVTKEILNSTAKFAEILESYGVEIPTKLNDKGSYIPALAKTDAGFTQLLDHENPIVQSLVAARLGVKSTGDESRARRYLWMATHGETLPVYLSYYAAHTGRWGGGDKTNFQNLRRGGVLRDCLLAPPGKTFVVGDFSQIEARINFWRAGDAAVLDQFRRGVDIYCDFGGEVYEETITKKDVLKRFVSKTGVLGLGFGCGWERLKNEVRAKGGYEISNELAIKVVDTFRVRKYPKVPAMWKSNERLLSWDIVDGAVESYGGNIRLPNGLWLQYPQLTRTRDGWKYYNGKRWVKLWGGVLAENIAQALARIIEADKSVELAKYYKVVTLTHDDIVLCVDDEEVEQAVGAMQEVMTRAQGWYADLPLACEIGVGKSLGEAK